MKSFWLIVLSLAALCAGAMDEKTRRLESARLHTELAAGYFSRAQYGVALEQIKDALEAESSYAPAYGIQGLIYSELREFDTAEKSFKRAVDLDPTNFDINHNYGWFLCYRVNRPKDSLRYFINAVKNPLYTTPQKSLLQAGLCAMKGNELDTAEDYLHQADRMQPDDPNTILGLATLSYSRGEYPNARMLLSRLDKLSPPTAESLWLGIRVGHKLGGDGVVGLEADLSNRFPQSEEARKLAKGQFD